MATATASFLTTAQAADKLDVSPAFVRSLAKRGKLAGAVRHGRDWLIPADAVAERRKKSAKNKLEKGGRPPKSNGDNELGQTKKTSTK